MTTQLTGEPATQPTGDTAIDDTAIDDTAHLLLTHRVSQFLYREARLLDEWRLTEWYDEMLTHDIRYLVPATDVHDETPTALGLIDDDPARLRQRIEQLLSGEVWCEDPKSRTHRTITNIEIITHHHTHLDVAANIIAHRFGHGRTDTYVGKYRYQLTPHGNTYRIRRRVIILDHETLYEHGKLSIIL